MSKLNHFNINSNDRKQDDFYEILQVKTNYI